MRQRDDATAHHVDEPAHPAAESATLARQQDEFAQLAHPHMTAVLRTAAALVGIGDAEDAAQEALKTWLLRITYNICMDWQRGRFGSDRHRTQPLPDERSRLPASLATDPGASDYAARLDLRQAVLLRYYVGLDATEIGVAVRLPTSTVHSHLRRARALLRAALDITDDSPPAHPQKEAR